MEPSLPKKSFLKFISLQFQIFENGEEGEKGREADDQGGGRLLRGVRPPLRRLLLVCGGAVYAAARASTIASGCTTWHFPVSILSRTPTVVLLAPSMRCRGSRCAAARWSVATARAPAARGPAPRPACP